METLENEINPSQSLKMITEVISKTRENLKEQSFCFLLWGWLIAIASFSFFVLHTYTSFKLYFLPFPVLVGIGIISSIMYYTGKNFSSETYLGYYLKILWLVLGIGFIAVVGISILKQYPPFTYTLLLGGIGTLITGLVMRFKPLIFGGILFLIISVASVFVEDDYKPLLQGSAVVIGYLVPGYLLKYKIHN